MANNNLTLRTINSPYVGNSADFTKKSVLTHKEVDNNFIFLKGEDIITGSTSGTTLILNQVNSDTIEIDLLPILTNPDNFTTGATVVGKSIYYNTKDTLSAYTTDLTNMFSVTNYGNIIFVSEVGATGLTRNDVIGDINKPVNLVTASSIAISGDTIHVKSGVYTTTTTSNNGLTVDGVNHYFEPNTKVYKSTANAMFGKLAGTTEGNVYGSGSFYGSGSCGPIFGNYGTEGSAYTQTYEWDICENTSEAGYSSLNSNENVILRGKRKITSSDSFGIYQYGSSVGQNLLIECPEIKSTVNFAIYFDTTASGGTGNLRVNAGVIENTSGGVALLWGGQSINNNVIINANYINRINTTTLTTNYNNATLNVSRIDQMESFNGTYLNVNGHLGFFGAQPSTGFYGIADIKLVDRVRINGNGTINTTFNGDFNYTGDTYGIANPGAGANLVSSLAGPITANYKLQQRTKTPPFSYKFVEGWHFTNGGGTMNMLGNWDIQDFWFSQGGGRLNIPSGTIINIGPKKQTTGNSNETFNFSSADVNIGGTIVERCDISGPCNTSQSAQTYSNSIMFVNSWGEASKPSSSTRVVYNGATIIVRDQNSQILTTSVTGGTVGIYSGGLNTNKMDSFVAEKEKLRVSVTGTSASLTVNTETFTSTTGATAAASAVELASLINASGTVAATASQDTPGTDGYIYVEADVAGNALTMSYGTNTLKNTTIRYNTKSIIDVVGGVLIEDENIIKDQFN